jgi:CRP/FNR family cyclic AMP-dependent transcriptional regulator
MILNTTNTQHFSNNDIQALYELGHECSFPRKARVFSQGDKGNSIYFINKGRIKIVTQDENGNESIIRYQGPGEYFGELSLLDHQPRSVTVETTTYSEFTTISKNDFETCLLNSPSLNSTLISALTARIRDLTEELTRCKLGNAYVRLRQKLYQLAVQQEDGTLLIEHRHTQDDLASLIGVSRETISYLMKGIKNGGWVRENSSRQLLIEKSLPQDY